MSEQNKNITEPVPELGKRRRANNSKAMGCFSWFGKILLLFIIIMAIYITIATLVQGRKLKQELAAMQQANVPMTMEQILGPAPAEKDNSFPLYQQASVLLKQRNETRMADTKLEYGSLKWSNPDHIALARSWVQQDADILKLVNQASQLPAYRSDVKWEDGFNALFPHLAQMRNIARLLNETAHIQAVDGDGIGLLSTLHQGFSLAKHSGQEPTLIGALVACAIDAITVRAAMFGITPELKISEDQARHLAEILAKPTFTQIFSQAMQGERMIGLQFYEAMKSPDGYKQLDPNASDETIRSMQQFAKISGFILYADQRYYLKMMNRYEELSKSSWRELVKNNNQDEFEIDNAPFYAFLSKMLLPVYSRGYMKRDIAIAQRDLLRIALGLQVYHQKHGVYPEKLDDLKTISWNVPDDVFSGKPFRYMKQDKTYLLYSYGQDLDDDKGKPVFTLLTEQEQSKFTLEQRRDMDKENGDLVWRVGFVK